MKDEIIASKYTPTIGLEVHVELSTTSKMFCGCTNAPHEALPNIHVCPVCMAHPGTLPSVNREAVRKVIDVGMALGSRVSGYTEFDRKNYFYPDIPKGYQISQYKYPLVEGGELAGVKITRIHLEEDTARSSHEHVEGSIVDYNRAGVPLMELVTEPVIHDAETAGRFGKELQLLLRELGVSEANMEKGEMRVEANISISDSETLGTKVEVKNLNSFKAVEGAIIYEVKRHTALLEKGEKIIQETRGWDDNKSATFSQRKKESSHDYRYFPDPDIPSFDTTGAHVYDISRLSEISAKSPSKIRDSYVNLGLPSKQIETLLENKAIRYYFNAVCAEDATLALIAANYLTSDVIGAVTSGAMPHIVESESARTSFTELCRLIQGNEVTSRVAKDLLPEVFQGISALSLVETRGLRIKKDSATLERIVSEVLAENPAVALEYQGGKVASIQFLVGQGMKKGKGAVDPASLRTEIERKLAV
jgi:aspartyl-tRNA(Asn)/glutamyl-tRNA(Gln) amidotransferase subunit B